MQIEEAVDQTIDTMPDDFVIKPEQVVRMWLEG